MDAPVIPSGAAPRRDPSPEVARMMRGIHTTLVLLVIGVFGLLVIVGIEVSKPTPAPAAPPVLPNSIAAAPRRVQLQVTGFPAAEVIGHIAYLDGSESEVAPGAYDVTGLAGASLELTAGDGFSTCRIVVDKDVIVEQAARDGQTVTCRWEATR